MHLGDRPMRLNVDTRPLNYQMSPEVAELPSYDEHADEIADWVRGVEELRSAEEQRRQEEVLRAVHSTMRRFYGAMRRYEAEALKQGQPFVLPAVKLYDAVEDGGIIKFYTEHVGHDCARSISCSAI